MERKRVEYEIISLQVEQTEVISRLLFTFVRTNYKNIWSERTFTATILRI